MAAKARNPRGLSQPTPYNAWSFRRGAKEIFALLHVTQRRMVVTDFSGQPIGPIFKGQADRPTGCPETSLTTSLRWLTTQESEDLIDTVQLLTCRTEKFGIAVLCYLTRCSLVERHQHSGGTCWHLNVNLCENRRYHTGQLLEAPHACRRVVKNPRDSLLGKPGTTRYYIRKVPVILHDNL
jgi:hypothetical protein